MQYKSLADQGFWQPSENIRAGLTNAMNAWGNLRKGGAWDQGNADLAIKKNTIAAGNSTISDPYVASSGMNPLTGGTAPAPGGTAAAAQNGAPPDPAQQWHPDNMGQRTVTGTDFATDDDIKTGQDNGVGYTGINTRTTPGVALPHDVLQAHFGDPKSAAGRYVTATTNGVSNRLPIIDMGPGRGASAGAGIDISASARHLFPGWNGKQPVTYQFEDPPTPGSRAHQYGLTHGAVASPQLDPRNPTSDLPNRDLNGPGPLSLQTTLPQVDGDYLGSPTNLTLFGRQPGQQPGQQPQTSMAAGAPTPRSPADVTSNNGTGPGPEAGGAPAPTLPLVDTRPNPSGLLSNASPEVQEMIRAKAARSGFSPMWSAPLLSAGDTQKALSTQPLPPAQEKGGSGLDTGYTLPPFTPTPLSVTRPNVPGASPEATPPTSPAAGGGTISNESDWRKNARGGQPPIPGQAITAATGVQTRTTGGQARFSRDLSPDEQNRIVSGTRDLAVNQAIAAGASKEVIALTAARITPAFALQKYDQNVAALTNTQRAPNVVDNAGNAGPLIQAEGKSPEGVGGQFLGPAFNAAHPNLMVEMEKFKDERQTKADADMTSTLEKAPGATAYIGNATRPGLSQVSKEMLAIQAGVPYDQIDKLSAAQRSQLAFRYEKTNDPGAIVRPEMFHLIANRAGLLDRYAQYFRPNGTLLKGTSMPASVALDLIKTVKLQTDSGREEFLKAMTAYDPIHRGKWGSFGGIEKSGIIPPEDKIEILSRMRNGGAPASSGAPAGKASAGQPEKLTGAEYAARRADKNNPMPNGTPVIVDGVSGIAGAPKK